MRVIITGGTGLVGVALAADLVKDGHEVIVLSRDPSRAKLPAGVRGVKWDALTSQGWGDLVTSDTAIVNLAGKSIAGDTWMNVIFNRWTPEEKRSILESRLNAGKAVVEAVQAAAQKPAVVIQASAVGYYGDRGNQPLTEETSSGSDWLAEVCRQWEDSTLQVEQLGVRRAIVRTGGVVLSTKGGSFPFMMLPFRLFVGGPLGSGKQWFSWIHMADEVGGIRFLIDNPEAKGVFNLNAPQNLTNAEFGRILGKVLKRPAFIPTPAFALKLVFAGKAAILLASQKQIPQRLVELGYKFKFPQAEPAMRDTLKK